jgi:hypothetical protein
MIEKCRRRKTQEMAERSFCTAEPLVCDKRRNGRDFGSQPRTGFASLHLLLTTQHIMFSQPNIATETKVNILSALFPLIMIQVNIHISQIINLQETVQF